MVLKVCAVFDSKAAYFGNPFFELTEEAAMRSFRDAVLDPNPKNVWNAHPEDFSLFVFGEFDNVTGEFNVQLPRSLVTASALKSVAAPPDNGRQLELLKESLPH